MLIRIINTIFITFGYTSLLVFGGLYTLRKYKQLKNNNRRNHLNKSDERVCIIGASEGIGKELAKQYAHRGAALVLVSRNTGGSLINLRTELIEAGIQEEKIECIPCDVQKPNEILNLVKKINENWDYVDTAIFNAGVLSTAHFEDVLNDPNQGFVGLEIMKMRIDSLSPVWTTNYLAYIYLAAYFSPLFSNSPTRTPNLVVVSSLAGLLPAPTRALYCGSKFAVQGFFRSLQLELASLNNPLNITLVIPSTIRTKLRERAPDANFRRSQLENRGMEPNVVAKEIINASDRSMSLLYLPHHLYWADALKGIFYEIFDILAIRKYKT